MAAAVAGSAGRQGLGAVAAFARGAVRPVAPTADMDGNMFDLLFSAAGLRFGPHGGLVAADLHADSRRPVDRPLAPLDPTRNHAGSPFTRQCRRLWDHRPGDGPESALVGSVQSCSVP